MSVLSNDQIMRLAPSVFAQAPDGNVSERYGFVPTMTLVEAFREQGWLPVRAQQTRVRDSQRQHVARHMLRFRRNYSPIEVGDSVAELVLTNSHDRSSAYQLDAGLFRLVCSNGMVCPIGDFGGIRVRHGKNVVDDIIEGSYELLDEVPQIAASVEAFRDTQLDSKEQSLFAEAALEVRYGEDWPKASPVRTDQILGARRREDEGDNLWATFSRVQENLLRGSLRGRARNGRRVRTRAVNSVSEDVRLNRALWRLAQRFADLKAA